ncbi:unnamed protein product [Lota lota]
MKQKTCPPSWFSGVLLQKQAPQRPSQTRTTSQQMEDSKLWAFDCELVDTAVTSEIHMWKSSLALPQFPPTLSISMQLQLLHIYSRGWR